MTPYTSKDFCAHDCLPPCKRCEALERAYWREKMWDDVSNRFLWFAIGVLAASVVWEFR